LKISTCSALLLGLLVLGTSVVAAATLDRAGLWQPSDMYSTPEPGGVRALINDGSFEQGPPPASAWTETSDWPCEWIGDWSSAWYVSSWDGYIDYWAGGYCYDENSGLNQPTTSSVRQSIFIPAGNAILSFYYVSFRVDGDDDPPDGDRAYVSVDGVVVWELPFLQATNTYPNWYGPVLVDLGAWQGQTVELELGGVSEGTGTGNLRFDFFELLPGGGTPVERASWGRVKSLY